jgi:TldD protein
MRAPEALFPSDWTKPKKQADLLKLAKSILLEPTGLSEQDLHHTFGNMFTHQLDDADLYFQHTRSESWSLEEGIVKSGSFSIDQGVGVRAIYGDKTAFAYSDEINLEALNPLA